MTVYLVGAGPGDPGLITVRGAELLGRAEVVVYDRLSVASLLDLAPPGAERISVGKAAGRAVMAQADIDALLVERGLLGQCVVRLKGGDPFVFARGGEEAQALLAAGVPFEVVPGISSAIAAPAYAGIPVTMRHSSTSFTVITGHEDPDKGGEIDWETVARLGGTIVILMGVGRLAKIVERLLAGGLPPDTPAAAVRWGTRPEQHTVRATLATLADHPLESPTTIVIGPVAGLDLDWFESKPLFGRRVVVTRAREQASSLAAGLRGLGAQVVEAPTIVVAEPSDGGVALAEAVERLASYDWLVVTSANGARRLLAALRDGRALGGVSVAAIGNGTAATLLEGNIVADLIPERSVAEGLLEVFPPPPARGGRVLLPRAAVARDVLPDGLRAAGWVVDVVETYRTEAAPIDHGVRSAVAGSEVVTFTSASTVDRFIEAFGVEGVPAMVASIGPITSERVRAHGLEVAVEASDHSVAGLIDALANSIGRPRTRR